MITIFENNAKHIFRNAKGHLSQDTPENRELLMSIVTDKNLNGVDENGTSWYSKIFPDETQVWVCVRDSKIRNGGINLKPRKLPPI
ncbi:MAG: hypothetical protein HQM11_14540 [SAR324 cluster bacterium]|nr:hypothetical protein [SAR324 cluster bacterium]